jgi:hypothetical protein
LVVPLRADPARHIGPVFALHRGVTRGLGLSLMMSSLVALGVAAMAAEPGSPSPVVLQRFLALDDPTPTQFRALRHLEARNEKFEKSAWMDVWTEADASGFRFVVIAEDGSEYIRSKVFRASLETEQKMWASGEPDKATVTSANYVFGARSGEQLDGLLSLTVKPRRKDMLLIDGSIFLNPDDGELVRMEGRLSKAPSFWARHVEIVRWYQRIAGFRMPTALESVAHVMIAGPSTFKMTYEYETINGQRVGNPQPRSLARNGSR